MDTSWPSTDVDLLRGYVTDGMRICHIVEAFSGRYKRGAIVGKIRRLKLPRVKRKNALPRVNGHVTRISDEGKPGVIITALDKGQYTCHRVLCDKDDNFLRDPQGHALFCGVPTDNPPYCAECAGMINNPLYGFNRQEKGALEYRGLKFSSSQGVKRATV